jgi:putative transposase
MPYGLERLHSDGDDHFITFSCYDRRPYLNTPTSRDLVEDALERTRKRYKLLIFGYVIMPEHVHILLSEPPTGTIADVMKSWKLSVTLRQPIRPFWEERYYDFNVFRNKKHPKSFATSTGILCAAVLLHLRKIGCGRAIHTTRPVLSV